MTKYLFPWHRHVFKEFEHSVGDVLERTKVHALVAAELFVGHITMIFDDLANVLWGHVLLVVLDIPKFSLLPISLGIELLPTT